MLVWKLILSITYEVFLSFGVKSIHSWNLLRLLNIVIYKFWVTIFLYVIYFSVFDIKIISIHWPFYPVVTTKNGIFVKSRLDWIIWKMRTNRNRKVVPLFTFKIYSI